MFFEDLLADLPAPRDDEPPSLRDDIADELADHLHCALRRELLKDGDAVAAEERVIDRFGNPKKLARRLWWQAMWSRIMGQRILSGLQWLLTLAAVVLAGLVFRQQSELITEIRTARETDAKNYQVISEVMQRLQQQSGPSAHQEVGQYEPGDSAQGSAGPGYYQPENADGGSYYPGNSEGEQRETASNVSLLTIKFVQEAEDGPPVTALELALEGRHGRVAATGPLSEPVTVTRMVDGKEISEVVARATGAYLFQVQEPGRYQLNTYLSDGQFSEQSVLIRPNEKREMTVICPKPREQVLVALTAPPLPQELQSLQCELEIVLNDQSTTLNGVEWNATSPNCQRVKFDPQGGPVVEIQNQANGETINLRRSKPEERAVVLLSGPVQYSYHLAPRRDVATNVAVWPGQRELLTKVIVPGENHWELELAEELLTEAKKLFVHDDSPVTATETSDSMAVHDEPAFLSVKLVQGEEGGPPVLGAMAALRWGQFYSEQREETRPFQPRYSEDEIPFAEVFQPVKGNVFRFSGLKPDRYSLEITLLDGQVCKQQVLIRDDQPKELTVICPAAREKAPVLITAPLLPDDLRESKYKLWCRVTAAPLGLGAVAWKAANAEANTSIVIFDPATGKPQEIDGTPFDPTTSEDDRVVFLMTGPNRARIRLYRDGDAITLIETDWPKVPGDEVLQTVKPGENRWELELSDEMLAAARKRLAENSPAEDSFDELAGARTETATGKLSVVLHQESPAMWEMFRSVKSLDSSRLVVTNHRTKRAAQPSSFFLNQDQANRSTARFEFDRLESGGSVLKVELPDGQMLNQNVVVSEETPQQIELDAPRERYRLPVLLSIPPLPDDLKQANWRLSVQLTELPLVKNELEWSLKDPYVYRMGFNTDGSASYLVRPHLGTLQYGQSPQADNPAVLALGPVRCRFQLRVNNTDVGNGMIEQPLEDAEIRVLEAKTNDGGFELEQIAWNLELPEKFLAAAREQLHVAKDEAKPAADESAKSKIGESGE